MIHFALDTLQREDCSSPDEPCELLTPPSPVVLGDRVVEVRIWAKAPVNQAQLDGFARFLNDYANMEPPFAAAIRARYTDKDGDLIEWLEEILDPPYWVALFPGCKSAAQVDAGRSGGCVGVVQGA